MSRQYQPGQPSMYDHDHGMQSASWNPPEHEMPRENRFGNTLNRQHSRYFDTIDNSTGPSSAAERMPPPATHLNDYNNQYIPRIEPLPHFGRMHNAVAPQPMYDTQTWNYGSSNTAAHTMNGAMNGTMNGVMNGTMNGMMNGTGRMGRSPARRAPIPSPWMNEDYDEMKQRHLGGLNVGATPATEASNPFSPSNDDFSRQLHLGDDSDELIPTAIVIKNIPFAVKKEQIVEMMTNMGLPLPYAFNYHFDKGIFRGLAFANFTNPDETTAVITHMNGLDLHGRKLRVEYKKMLPAQERERIERGKREKRGQLQEQHEPIAPGHNQNALANQASFSSLSSNNRLPTSPSPVSLRGRNEIVPGMPEVDMNDPTTLRYFGQLCVFNADKNQHALEFEPSMSGTDRRLVHILAHNLGLLHKSEGEDSQRRVVIRKKPVAVSPPPAGVNYYSTESHRRGLNRAATIDFSETRETGYHTQTLGHRGSGLLDIPGSPGIGGFSAAHNLRAAKSFADLRSYTPSPVPSTASFPVGLSQNISRYTDYGNASAASNTPNLTPTSAGGLNNRDEAFLSNGLSSMTIGFDRPSTNRLATNGRIGQERENHASTAGPIGSQRPVNGNSYAESSQNGAASKVERQPKGPGNDWGAGNGFSRPRQNGHYNRGSGELDPNSFENSWDDNTAQDSSDRNGGPSSSSRYH